MANVVGISALDKESTVTLVQDGVITWAVSEERLTRVKQQRGFPWGALEMVFERSGVGPGDVEAVCYPFLPAPDELALRRRRAREHNRENGKKHGPASRLYHRLNLFRELRRDRRGVLPFSDRELAAGLARWGLGDKLHRYPHEPVHAANAFYTSGFSRALAVVFDAYGTGDTGGVYRCGPDGIEQLTAFPWPNSLGDFYSRVTKALGFTPDRHEGKILGLAAFAPAGEVFDLVRPRFEVGDGRFFYINSHDPFYVPRLARRFPREQVAAAHQDTLEAVAVAVVRPYLQRTGERDVVLSGGVTANVKLNQRIAELPEVDRIFVHPAMSDMGTGTGAAYLYLSERGRARPYELPHALLGPDYSDAQCRAALEEAGLAYTEPADLVDEVARLLADGSVVAWFDGRMEYGPRALGSRSVLARATDPEINKWLNNRLRRTEFMPFAPVTLPEHAERCYIGLEKCRHTAEFMTVTLDCTAYMKEVSPAAVHVDGTARPQIANRETTPRYYDVLARYHALTGIPSLINTSFNIHEEPIVCTPADAVRAFRQGHLDYLALGPCLVKNPVDDA